LPLLKENRRGCEYVKGEGFKGLRLSVVKDLIALTNEGQISWDAYCEARYQWATNLADKFNTGERWFSLSDDPYHCKNHRR